MAHNLLMTEKKKTEQITVRLEPEAYEKLKKYAEAERRSAGFLVRDLIDAYIRAQEAGRTPSKKRA